MSGFSRKCHALSLMAYVAVLFGFGMSPAENAPIISATGAADDAPPPRIGIRHDPAGAFFFSTDSGEVFTPCGFNYIRLRHGDHATFEAAT